MLEDDLNDCEHLGNLPGQLYTRGPKATMYTGRPGLFDNMLAFQPQRTQMPLNRH